MELFEVKQGGAQDPALLPPGSSASRVAPEGHWGEPWSAAHLCLKTKDLVPLLTS